MIYSVLTVFNDTFVQFCKRDRQLFKAIDRFQLINDCQEFWIKEVPGEHERIMQSLPKIARWLKQASNVESIQWAGQKWTIETVLKLSKIDAGIAHGANDRKLIRERRKIQKA